MRITREAREPGAEQPEPGACKAATYPMEPSILASAWGIRQGSVRFLFGLCLERRRNQPSRTITMAKSLTSHEKSLHHQLHLHLRVSLSALLAGLKFTIIAVPSTCVMWPRTEKGRRRLVA